MLLICNKCSQIVLIGSATTGSTVLIDSFRYIPASTENDFCKIYEDSVTTTEPDLILETECIAYDFGADFETKFNRNGLCRFMLEWTWTDTLTSNGGYIYSNSISHISAGNFPSCTSSFNFNMMTGGVIEINVYIASSSLTDNDHVDVIVYRTGDDGSSTIIEETVYSPLHESFVNNEWYNLKLDLQSSTTLFTGYVSLLKFMFIPWIIKLKCQ